MPMVYHCYTFFLLLLYSFVCFIFRLYFGFWVLHCYKFLIFIFEMKLQLTALSNSPLHPHPSSYSPALSPEPLWWVLGTTYPSLFCRPHGVNSSYVSFPSLGFICYHPSICFPPSKNLLKSLICWWTLFCLFFLSTVKGFILFYTLVNVHHLNWKLLHKLYIDLSWVNKTALQTSQDFTRPTISRRRIKKFFNNLKILK